jgi:hypothetical protein
LLDKCPCEHRVEKVLKLASLPKASIDAILVKRGINPAAIADVKTVLTVIGTPITATQAVEYSFTSRGTPPKFGKGRFGDGSAPVFYSALAKETCEAEVRYHLQDAVAAAPFPRFYNLIECTFSGTGALLHGQEVHHPELISSTEDGYPFCQALADEARSQDIHTFLTPSARHAGGTCTPVFSRAHLSSERSVGRGVFKLERGNWKYEHISP